ncbi:hypothetical protein AMK20_26445 [Streptomyces sp. TSRI0261]|nr:hypothetical protein AMK20_26445 [Streptomyces sp. TSRI0261]
MEQRTLGRTGRDVSVVGQGTWQLGGDWGEVAEDDAFGVLDAAVESGVTFFDTADVKDTVFGPEDHRTYNRHGEAFDRGETFSGIDYATGVAAAAEFAELAPEGATPAQTALRWIIQQPGVTSVIPGARSVEQARANAAAAALPPLPQATLDAVRDLCDRSIRAEVHDRW